MVLDKGSIVVLGMNINRFGAGVIRLGSNFSSFSTGCISQGDDDSWGLEMCSYVVAMVYSPYFYYYY